MKMFFKQRFFSWFDSYDIYAEDGSVMFTVVGQLSWGHRLKVLDAEENHIATLQERVLTFLPAFEIYFGDDLVGTIKKEFTLFSHKFDIDYNGWYVDGDFLGWDYSVFDADSNIVATITKEILNFTDTYIIDVADPADALDALMLVLAIDAEKCSSK